MQKAIMITVLVLAGCADVQMKELLPSKEVISSAAKAESPGDVIKVVKQNIKEKKEAYAIDTSSDTAPVSSATPTDAEKPSWLQLAVSSLIGMLIGGASVYIKKKGGSLPV